MRRAIKNRQTAQGGGERLKKEVNGTVSGLSYGHQKGELDKVNIPTVRAAHAQRTCLRGFPSLEDPSAVGCNYRG